MVSLVAQYGQSGSGGWGSGGGGSGGGGSRCLVGLAVRCGSSYEGEAAAAVVGPAAGGAWSIRLCGVYSAQREGTVAEQLNSHLELNLAIDCSNVDIVVLVDVIVIVLW